jgi:hypothetical protein
MLTADGAGSGATDSDYGRAREEEAGEAHSVGATRREHDDRHLRSCEALKGYHIHATDGDIGHVDGFLVDQQTWAIRYLIVNTSNWWLGHQVLMAPTWFAEVSWEYSKVTTNLTRQEVKNSTTYDSLLALGEGATFVDEQNECRREVRSSP